MRDFGITCVGPWCVDEDGRTARSTGPLGGVPDGWRGESLYPMCPLCFDVEMDLSHLRAWLGYDADHDGPHRFPAPSEIL